MEKTHFDTLKCAFSKVLSNFAFAIGLCNLKRLLPENYKYSPYPARYAQRNDYTIPKPLSNRPIIEQTDLIAFK